MQRRTFATHAKKVVDCLARKQFSIPTVVTTDRTDPCKITMLHCANVHDHVERNCAVEGHYDSCSLFADKESRDMLVRRGAVGRRCAIVALPTAVLATMTAT